jgi:hypothetical protein
MLRATFGDRDCPGEMAQASTPDRVDLVRLTEGGDATDQNHRPDADKNEERHQIDNRICEFISPYDVTKASRKSRLYGS